MNTILKLYNILQLFRIRDAVDDFILAEQAGFRPNRGTDEQTAALFTLLDDARNFKGRQIIGMFVDFSKAFDSIHRWCIDAVLNSWHCPRKTILEVMEVMEGHLIKIDDGESTSDCIPTTIGVLQGDTLAPYLFVLVLDGLLRKLYQFPGFHGPHATTSHCDCVPVRFLAYADDIVLLAQNNKDLQGMFSALESNASLGLQINYGLDKTATFASAGHVEIHTRDGKLIEQTSIYKYLGSFAALTPDKELSAKKGKAWAQIKAWRLAVSFDATSVPSTPQAWAPDPRTQRGKGLSPACDNSGMGSLTLSKNGLHKVIPRDALCRCSLRLLGTVLRSLE